MRKTIKIILIVLGAVILGFFCFFFVGKARPAEKVTWGVAFSQKHADLLGLDWQENYLALLDDLGVKDLKLIAYWDIIEPKEGEYDFEDLDWQIEKASQRGARILLVVGRKVPRWPECHEPDWVQNQKSKIPPATRAELREARRAGKNQKLLEYIGEIVNRYKDNESIWAWQVENEPFFPFGKCPPPDEELLKKEVSLVKSLDEQRRPVVVTESGEIPLWFKAAKLGDIVGHTLYRKVWVHQLRLYFDYPFPPVYYGRKAWLIDKIFHKKVICIELQAEPWGPVLLYDLPLKEQGKTMNLKRFKKVIKFAKQTGNDTFYLWGAEWWYWMKVNQGNSSIWDEAKKLWD